MNDLETIETYLNDQMEAGVKRAFEARLATDPALTEQVAFYLQAKHTARQAALAERHAEWQTLRRAATPQRTRTVRIAYASLASAAAALFLFLGWWSLYRQPDAAPEQLANAYVQENFSKNLNVQMSGEADSLQTALNLANGGRNEQALTLLSVLLQRDPADAEAKKYAGIVALRAGKYDQAIAYFHALSQQPGLFSNSGTFYEAVALLKRGQPLDRNRAKSLLQTVVRENLEGKDEAAKWLEAWE